MRLSATRTEGGHTYPWYGNLGDRPLGGRYVRYDITAGVGLERKLTTEARRTTGNVILPCT